MYMICENTKHLFLKNTKNLFIYFVYPVSGMTATKIIGCKNISIIHVFHIHIHYAALFKIRRFKNISINFSFTNSELRPYFYRICFALNWMHFYVFEQENKQKYLSFFVFNIFSFIMRMNVGKLDVVLENQISILKCWDPQTFS